MWTMQPTVLKTSLATSQRPMRAAAIQRNIDMSVQGGASRGPERGELIALRSSKVHAEPGSTDDHARVSGRRRTIECLSRDRGHELRSPH
jgi:hypothetical protein